MHQILIHHHHLMVMVLDNAMISQIARALNIIMGIVFIILSPIGIIGVPTAYLPSMIIIAIVEIVTLVLIVWYAWKSKQKT